MIVRSYNPIEPGRPAIWLDTPIEKGGRHVGMLRRQLREHANDTLDLIVDGDGGHVETADEMAEVIRQDPRPKRVTILRAMSAHGVLAMAGDHIRIVEGGAIGLHGARLSRDAVLSFTESDALPATTLRGLAAMCEDVDARHCAIFAARTGLSQAEIAGLSLHEAVLDAAEAVRLGFADEVVPWPE